MEFAGEAHRITETYAERGNKPPMSGRGELDLERRSVIGPQQPDRTAICAQHGLRDGKAHSGAATIPAGGEEGFEDASAVLFRNRIAVVADGDRNAACR